MKKTLLFLDDKRNPMERNWLDYSPIGKDVYVEWVLSFQQFTDWIMINGLPDAICFDHDLGNEDTASIEDEKTGYDAAKWLCHYCMVNNKNLPLYAIQSSNTVGKENIDCYLKNFVKYRDAVKN